MDGEYYGALISIAYPSIDFLGIPGFPNYEPYLQDERFSQAPNFYGSGDSAVCHIIFVFSFVNKLNILHRDNDANFCSFFEKEGMDMVLWSSL